MEDAKKNHNIINSVIKYCIYHDTNEYVDIRKSIIRELGITNFNIEDLKEYENKLWRMITQHAIRFNKDDILYFAEYLREHYNLKLYPKNHVFSYVQLNEVGIYIQKVVIENLEKMGSGRNIFSRGNICQFIETIIMYDELIKKIEYMKNNLFECTYENLFEPIEDEKIDEFFDGHELYFNAEKIEDMVVKNTDLNNWLDRRGLLPKKIYKNADLLLQKAIGFTYSDIDTILMYANELEPYNVTQKHIRIFKDRFINIFLKYNISKDNLDNVIKYLSINECINNRKSSNRMLDLRCIIESEKDGITILNFGLKTFYESLGILKRISITGHFWNEIGIEEKNKDLFTLPQQQMSTFFSYLIGDMMENGGYVLPKKQSGLIEVEINEIKLPDKKLHFDDIDVLALDVKNRILYNCELKYFKAKMDYTSITTDGLNNKKYNSFMNRQKEIENMENKKKIIYEKFNITDGDNYVVKPIVITSRMNFNRKEIIEYSFEEFKRKILQGQVL